jgi:hypothetical protein
MSLAVVFFDFQALGKMPCQKALRILELNNILLG